MLRGGSGAAWELLRRLRQSVNGDRKPESYGAAPRRERSGPVDSAEHASVDVTADTITSAMYSAPPRWRMTDGVRPEYVAPSCGSWSDRKTRGPGRSHRRVARSTRQAARR